MDRVEEGKIEESLLGEQERLEHYDDSFFRMTAEDNDDAAICKSDYHDDSSNS